MRQHVRLAEGEVALITPRTYASLMDARLAPARVAA
jgi:hypothetical protein